MARTHDVIRCPYCGGAMCLPWETPPCGTLEYYSSYSAYCPKCGAHGPKVADWYDKPIETRQKEAEQLAQRRNG